MTSLANQPLQIPINNFNYLFSCNFEETVWDSLLLERFFRGHASIRLVNTLADLNLHIVIMSRIHGMEPLTPVRLDLNNIFSKSYEYC